MLSHVWFIVSVLVSSSYGDVQIYLANGIGPIVADYEDLPAAFGALIPPKGITVHVHHIKIYSYYYKICILTMISYFHF